MAHIPARSDKGKKRGPKSFTLPTEKLEQRECAFIIYRRRQLEPIFENGMDSSSLGQISFKLLKRSVIPVIELDSAGLEAYRFPSGLVYGKSKTLPLAEMQNLLGLSGLPGFEK